MIQRGNESEIYLKMEGAMIQRREESEFRYLKMEGALIQRGEESEIYLKMEGAMIQRGEGSEIFLKIEGAMIQRRRGFRNISLNGRGDDSKGRARNQKHILKWKGR